MVSIHIRKDSRPFIFSDSCHESVFFLASNKGFFTDSDYQRLKKKSELNKRLIPSFYIYINRRSRYIYYTRFSL